LPTYSQNKIFSEDTIKCATAPIKKNGLPVEFVNQIEIAKAIMALNKFTKPLHQDVKTAILVDTCRTLNISPSLVTGLDVERSRKAGELDFIPMKGSTQRPTVAAKPLPKTEPENTTAKKAAKKAESNANFEEYVTGPGGLAEPLGGAFGSRVNVYKTEPGKRPQHIGTAKPD
jgi:hypothetical protein